MGSSNGHSSLGASSAYRWMQCPGSIRLSAGIESTSSVYAMEGTAAHSLAETCLRKNQAAKDYAGRIIRVLDHGASILQVGAVASEERDFEVSEDMIDAVGLYLDVVRADLEATQGIFEVEKSFSLEKMFPGMNMFGTNDALIGEPWGTLRVYDYKHGAGIPVNAAGNPQLRYYALGAYLEQDYQDVEIVVVQPRARHADGPVRREKLTVDELLRWAREELFPAAKRTQEPDAPVIPGDWCRFCPALATCRAYADRAREITMSDFSTIPMPSPDTIGLDELLTIMAASEGIRNWLAAVFVHAQRQMESGADFPGWKLVRKRVNRRWTDEEAAGAALFKWRDMGIYKKSLISPAQMEKLLVKLGIEVDLSTWQEKPEGGITIAPESDRREAVIMGGFEAIEEAKSEF